MASDRRRHALGRPGQDELRRRVDVADPDLEAAASQLPVHSASTASRRAPTRRPSRHESRDARSRATRRRGRRAPPRTRSPRPPPWPHSCRGCSRPSPDGCTPRRSESPRRQSRDEVHARLRGEILAAATRPAPRSIRRRRSRPQRSDVKSKRAAPGRIRVVEIAPHPDPSRRAARETETRTRELMPDDCSPARTSSSATHRSRASNRCSRSGNRRRPRKWTVRWIGESPGIGGCARSNSQGWTVKTAGSPRSRAARSAFARRRCGRIAERPRAAERAARRPRTDPESGGISVRDHPSPSIRWGPRRFERRPSGGTGIIEASHRNPAAASAGRASAPGCRIDHSAARCTVARAPPAASIESRARSRSSRNSFGGHLVGATVRVAVHSDLVTAPRRLAQSCGCRCAIQPRKKIVARCFPAASAIEEPAERRLDRET